MHSDDARNVCLMLLGLEMRVSAGTPASQSPGMPVKHGFPGPP